MACSPRRGRARTRSGASRWCDLEHRERGAGDAEADGAPHDERDDGKRQGVQSDRNHRQVAEDHEHAAASTVTNVASSATRRGPDAKQAWQREDERRDEQHARAVAQPVDEPGCYQPGIGLNAGRVERRIPIDELRMRLRTRRGQSSQPHHASATATGRNGDARSRNAPPAAATVAPIA